MRNPIRLIHQRLRAHVGRRAPGRHTAAYLTAAPPPPPRPLPAHVRDRARPLVGEDVALVRPYLTAYEARRDRDRTRARPQLPTPVDYPTLRLAAV